MANDDRQCILIIEDDPMMLRALGNMLKVDYNILAAKDGERGISFAKRNSPDVILLDIMMPGMTGFDVIGVLKADDETKNIPVIFLTGDDSDISKEKGYKLGAADYIEKPFVANALKERIRACCN